MAQLRQHQADLDALKTRVLTISFVAGHWAEAWLAETGSPYPLLLDPERRIYRAYGLGRAVASVWGPRTLLDYARRVLKGERLRGIRGDPHQLGADFIISADGARGPAIRLAHYSGGPVDRPAVIELLRALR